MICTNPDLIVDRGNKRELCAGSVAMVFEKMGGNVIYFGKPYPEVYNQAIENKDKFSGATVHLVTPKLDSGKIILQKKIKISKIDTEITLAKKVLKIEHKLYPAAIEKFLKV